jgi:hypothetical protein
MPIAHTRPSAAAFAAFFVLALAAPGEPFAGLRRSADGHAVMSAAEALSLQARRPPQEPQVAPEALPRPERPSPYRVAGRGGGSLGPTPPTAPIANPDLSPPPSDSFEALADNGSFIPPDTHGAVGPNHLMVSLNSEIRFQDRSGTDLGTLDLYTFWSPVGGLDGTFDPKTIYDPYGGRFISTAMANGRDTNSSVLIGVSADSSPTGTWYLYRIDADTNDATWADYPSIGFNRHWIIVQVNMFDFSDSYVRSQIYAFDRTNLYANGAGNYTLFQDGQGFAQAPAMTYDTNMAAMLLIEEWDSTAGEHRLCRIDGPVGSETYTTNIAFISTNIAWTFSPPGRADLGPQLGTTRQIQLNDSRAQNAVYRNESLWFTHNVPLPAGGDPTRSGIMWWQVTTNGAILQVGLLQDTNNQLSAAFPSLAVNARGDMLVGYSCFAPKFLASGCYAYRSSNDPPGTLRSARILKAGEDVYYKVFSGTRNRWGDYSHTQVDPVNDVDFWTIQEYARPRSGSTFLWGTWWGRIEPTSNRAPAITMSGPHVVPIGATTNFAVSASDADGNTVTLTNTLAPSGSTFSLGTFSWTAPASAEDTTNVLAFEANDGQGLFNSVATSRTELIVPFDSDGDFVGDAWEFQHFGTLTNPATADNDQDGNNNYVEFIAGTTPTNAGSAMEVQVFVQVTATGRLVVAATEPGHRYAIEYSDTAPSDAATWARFANAANGIGTWIETSAVPAQFMFVDDEGTNSTGAASSTGRRGYRVVGIETAQVFTVYLRELATAPEIDGTVSPAEYSVARAQFFPDADDGFGGINGIGGFYAGYASNKLFIGLQGATLEDNGQNGIVIFLESPRLAGGWRNPALGADQGEVGDVGTPQYAESLATRANVLLTNYWLMPEEDFVDLAFAVVDQGAVVSQQFADARDNMGLYKFAYPQHGNNLGFLTCESVWRDTFTTNGGLELSIGFSELGGLQTGDVVSIVAFITSISGFTSNESLPANAIDGSSPGFLPVTFGGPPIKLQVGGPGPGF